MKLAEEHGAGWTINYNEEDWVKRVEEITEGKGVAAVFDGVGKVTFDGDLEVLSPKGSLVSFGNASGEVEPLRIRTLAPKNIKLSRPYLPGYIATRDAYEGYMTELFNWMVQSQMRVTTGGIYALEDAAKAHEDLEGRKTTGKLLKI
ncbi:MAG: hypothetical protein M1823_004718 [Watsoniomyces obsoletus]|nr:MAG: hypothetical protein M1823_004718 [Watsoniomyces obsoletus]